MGTKPPYGSELEPAGFALLLANRECANEPAAGGGEACGAAGSLRGDWRISSSKGVREVPAATVGSWGAPKRTPGPRWGANGGGAGMPVNSCTMARKLEVSVVTTVVGGRREARGRFRGGLRAADDDAEAEAAGGTGSCELVAGKKELVDWSRKSAWSSRKAEAGAPGDGGELSLAVEDMGGGEREGVDRWMEM